MLRLACFVVPVVALSLACSDTRPRLYTLDIKNDSSRPITVGLVKLGDPVERAWLSPEEVAQFFPRDMTLTWGTVIPPNKTAYIDDYRGEFYPNASAELRIYAGQLPLSDLLAISRQSLSRKDLRLEEGKSTYVVNDRGPYIDAYRTSYVPGGEAAKNQPNVHISP